jgi:two-component system, cell cycle response regulator DivK
MEDSNKLKIKDRRNIKLGTLNPTVMLVEDFDDTRHMMRWLLEMSGYRVVEAVNGEEAVKLAARECPDLILMDLSLPLIDGFTATRKIKEFSDLRNIPVVAVSAYNTPDLRSHALNAGCVEYVPKPVDFDQLETLMSRLLEENRLRPCKVH